MGASSPHGSLAARHTHRNDQRRTKSECDTLTPVALRTCTVSFTGLSGVRHSVEVTAESIMKPPPGVATLKTSGWADVASSAFRRGMNLILVAADGVRRQRKCDETHMDDIGVRDVPGSFKWYQSLFGQPETPPKP